MCFFVLNRMASSRAIRCIDEKNYTENKKNRTSTTQTLEHFPGCIKCALDLVHFADKILGEFCAEHSVLQKSTSIICI